MRVDHGGPPDHVVRKCRQYLETVAPLPHIARLISAEQFMLTIITVGDEKAADIKECIRRQTWPVFFRVASVPDLGDLLASQRLSPGRG